MLRRVVTFDWAATSCGPLESWPDSLCVAVRLMLSASTPMGVIAGRDNVLVYNDAMHGILGDAYPDAFGAPIARALPAAADFYRKALGRCVAGRAAGFHDEPLKIIRDGRPITAWFNLEFIPILDFECDYLGAMVVAAETTSRVLAERALQRSEERLTAALGASGLVGAWDLDLRTGRMSADERFARLHGVDPAAAAAGTDSAQFTNAVHPDDRAGLAAKMLEMAHTGQEFRCRYRVLRADGRVCWLVASGKVIADKGGYPCRLPGVVVDITEQVEAAAALAESEFRFQTLAEMLPQIVWSCDAAGAHDYFNRRWFEFTGIAEQAITSETWKELVHPEDWPRVDAEWRHSMATGETYDIEYRFRHRSGMFRWLRVMALPLRDREANIARWFGTSTDIHESKMFSAERETLAAELDHRIKNMFAVIGSLATLAARAEPQHAAFAERLCARIAALSQAHALTIRAAARCEAAQSFHAVVRELLAPYDGDASRISCSGDDFAVGQGALTGLALIFHEMATNAAKYGALCREHGSIAIRTMRAGDRYCVEWCETAPGEAARPPAAERPPGFGSKLLISTVERRMDGRIAREWRAHGLCVALEFPLRSLL